MKTKLLSKLRKEAKKNVYLIPWKFDEIVREVIIVEEDGTDKYFRGIKYSKSSYCGYMTQFVFTSSSAEITDGYSVQEGIDKLREFRIEYILNKIKKLKEERNNINYNKNFEKAKKELKKY